MNVNGAFNVTGKYNIFTDANPGYLATQRAWYWLERHAGCRPGASNRGVHLADIAVVWHIVWNATATFIAVIIISLLLDESGFFEWSALHVARWGKGRGRLLFSWIILLGAMVAALFANDGAALILTPIVIAMLLALGFSPAATLAFVMAAGFIADTASLPLIVSNLVNIVSADFFKLGFTHYAAVMVPVNLAAIATTLLMLHLFFRKEIPAVYDISLLKAPKDAIRDGRTFKAGWLVLTLLLRGEFRKEDGEKVVDKNGRRLS